MVAKRIIKKGPAWTIHKGGLKKRPAMKRPSGRYNRKVAGTKADPRRNGQWLWMAVSVGKGKTMYSHGDGTKSMTFAILPPRAQAPDGKPRGVESMAKVIKTHIKPKSFLVFDGWQQSAIAVKKLGYKHAPPVNHTTGWRDVVTGFHSNDIESENARLKRVVRKRYSTLDFHMNAYKASGDADNEGAAEVITDSLLLHEYQFYMNIGSGFDEIMHWLALVDGSKSSKYIVK